MFKATPIDQEKIDIFLQKPEKYAGAIGGRYDIIITPYTDKVEYQVYDCIDKDSVVSYTEDFELSFSQFEKDLFDKWIVNKEITEGRLSYCSKNTSLGVIFYVRDNIVGDSVNLTDFCSF